MLGGHLNVWHQIDTALAMLAPWKQAWKHCSCISTSGSPTYDGWWNEIKKSIASSPLWNGGIKYAPGSVSITISWSFLWFLCSWIFCKRHEFTAMIKSNTFWSICNSFWWNDAMSDASFWMYGGKLSRLDVAPKSAIEFWTLLRLF